MSFLPGRLRSDHARERWSNDYYVEPVSCVRSLFDSVPFEGAIHDPCCGGGTIPRTAIEYGYRATGADLVDRGYAAGGVRDFLLDEQMRDNIVSNPPYNLAEEMFEQACLHAKRKVAFVLRISFLAGQRRRDRLFKMYRPSEVLILSKRPSMPPGGTDIPAKGGTVDYCFILWDRTYFGPTIMRWV